MRKSSVTLLVFFFLLLGISLSAQVRSGNLYGKVVDTGGVALPGVSVTLTGSLTAPVHVITTADGAFRFISLAPARDYSLKAELEGFKTTTRSEILVVAGGDIEVTMTMEVGSLSEEVTVTAVAPILNPKKTQIGLHVSQEVMQSLPTARDPFAIMKMAPGAITYREDVGGSEGGNAIISTVRANGSQNLYVIDGLITNESSNPATVSTYYDFDTFEEMSIIIGGADVTSPTGGMQINMVTRRGGNKISFGGRYYLTDKYFQADNMTQALRDEGLSGTNRIDSIRDYGFNLGGPIIKDKIWMYGSYGMLDSNTITIYDLPSKILLQTVLLKLNLQIIPQNRFEIFAQGNKKVVRGIQTSPSNPEGNDREPRKPWGYPTFRIQDEHMFGDNMFISLQYGHHDGGFISRSARDPEGQKLAIWDFTDQRWYGGGYMYPSDATTPGDKYTASLTYFNDKLFGMTHEIKFGIDYFHSRTYVEAGYPGNLLLERNFVDPVADFDSDGFPDIPNDPNFYSLRLARNMVVDNSHSDLAGYFSDTLSFGRFSMVLGIRYDQQWPTVNKSYVPAIIRDNGATTSTLNANTTGLLDMLLPGVQIPEVKGTAADGSRYYWKVWSPRFNLTYDITGDSKTFLKLTFARFGNLMHGELENRRWTPGGYAGWLYFYWMDNGDHMADFSELYWYTIGDYQLYRVFDDAGNFTGNWQDGADKFWGGYDYTNPSELDTTSYARIDADAGSPMVTELSIALEREIFPNAAVQLNLVYRKNDNTRLVYKYFPDTDTLIDQSFYVPAGDAPASIPGIGDTGEAKNNEWYYLNEQATAYSPYTWEKKNRDYSTDFWGIDLVFTKRLSNRWMLNGSFSYQWTLPRWGKTGVLDQTNRWAIDGINNGCRWMFKISGLYQLPFNINVSANLVAHEGLRVNRTVNITDYRLPNPKSNSAKLYLDEAGSEALPGMFNMSARVEKMFKILENGRIYLMVDVFNALNLTTAESRSEMLLGNYYIYPDSTQNVFVPNINSYRLTKILNPLVARFGVRFVF